MRNKASQLCVLSAFCKRRKKYANKKQTVARGKAGATPRRITGPSRRAVVWSVNYGWTYIKDGWVPRNGAHAHTNALTHRRLNKAPDMQMVQLQLQFAAEPAGRTHAHTRTQLHSLWIDCRYFVYRQTHRDKRGHLSQITPNRLEVLHGVKLRATPCVVCRGNVLSLRKKQILECTYTAQAAVGAAMVFRENYGMEHIMHIMTEQWRGRRNLIRP